MVAQNQGEIFGSISYELMKHVRKKMMQFFLARQNLKWQKYVDMYRLTDHSLIYSMK